jgi:type VI secretion system protein ImpH
MADEDRAPPHPVEQVSAEARKLYEALAAAPHAFDFFQALRRIDAVNSDRPRMGESLRLVDPVRLGQIPSVIFAPSTLAEFHPAADGRPARLLSYFFGLFGPSGALPIHLTEYARDRMRNENDPTIVRFLDLFHHRFLSLFYRAWAQARPTVSFDRPGADRFSAYLATLFGLGLPALRNRDGMPDHTKLHFTGRFALQTRNVEGLRAIIADYFKLPASIQEFMPEWIYLPRQSLCVLGGTPETATLGSTATIGERIKVNHLKFRIHIGPLTLGEYERLLPIGFSLDRLEPIVRNYIGDELSWDVNLILLQPEVPSVRLGQGAMLGWTSWLGVREKKTDAAELILEPTLKAA